MLDKNLACLLDDSDDDSEHDSLEQDDNKKENRYKKLTRENNLGQSIITKIPCTINKKKEPSSTFNKNTINSRENLAYSLKHLNENKHENNNINFDNESQNVKCAEERKVIKNKEQDSDFPHKNKKRGVTQLFPPFSFPKIINENETNTKLKIITETDINSKRNKNDYFRNENLKNGITEVLQQFPDEPDNDTKCCDFNEFYRHNNRKGKNDIMSSNVNNDYMENECHFNTYKDQHNIFRDCKDNSFSKLKEAYITPNKSPLYKQTTFYKNVGSSGNCRINENKINENRDEANREKISLTSESNMYYDNLKAQTSKNKEFLIEKKTNKNNYFNSTTNNSSYEINKNITNKAIKYNKGDSKNSLSEKRSMRIFEASADNTNNNFELNLPQKRKQQRTLKFDSDNDNTNRKANNQPSDSDGVSSSYDYGETKTNDPLVFNNKSNLSPGLIGPAGLRQKLKSFNNSEHEKNKELIYYFSFIKYKSWIKALNILNFPLDNFHLSINSHKYLLGSRANSDMNTIDNNNENMNEDLFMYRNNIHNILNNKKITNYRIDRMIVIVKSILSRHNGHFLIVMDPSGHMPATLHKEIEKEHKKNIDVGCTLFLRDATIFQTIDNYPYLIITLRSLVRVIKAEQTELELKEKIFKQLQI